MGLRGGVRQAGRGKLMRGGGKVEKVLCETCQATFLSRVTQRYVQMINNKLLHRTSKICW